MGSRRALLPPEAREAAESGLADGQLVLVHAAVVPVKQRGKSQINQLQEPIRGTDRHDVADIIAQNR